jgi:hypothetical protein
MTTLTLRLRHDCHTVGPDGLPEPVPARDEDVDPDVLSPRARALAEAIADCGRGPLNIVMETRTPPENGVFTPEQQAAWAELAARRPAADPGVRLGTVTVTRMPADSPRTAEEYLETTASNLAGGLPGRPHWYPVGAGTGMLGLGTTNVRRVPSADAAAEDPHLTRDAVLARTSYRGRPMGITAWDTLIGTGYLPDPDRYVAGRTPQWLPATVDAWLDRPREIWTLSQVAEHLRYGGAPATAAGSARKQLHLWGITATGRAPGRGGESQYDADQVRAAHANRPGRGARTGR